MSQIMSPFVPSGSEHLLVQSSALAHFRLKKVNSTFLEQLAIIDTPGMLDSVSERDRGYNYQEVIEILHE